MAKQPRTWLNTYEQLKIRKMVNLIMYILFKTKTYAK